ncbi:GumC family protein [Pedobacter mendelii]|uniref:non-specific protein-tyrosine kinase n=1 Tax=Pedobacter mendelii TaxID=1908240 RepID=A0ABQ2BMW4_9SPHI|nr:polysaccharide biosynthesis tyrosine autokinase [Pedobacter mendelii]GGI28241.1 tyrosine protein kinase [Pedobacter mendelii]
MPELNVQSLSEEEEGIDIKKIFGNLLLKWHWFLISAVVCLIIAFLYSRYTPPVYRIAAKVLVNDDQKGGGLNKQAGALMDLGGIMGGQNSVENEIEILRTRFLMEQVVRQMQLNIVYYHKANLVNRELYEAPFKLNILSSVDTISPTLIQVKKLASDKLRVSSKDFEKDVSWNQRFEIKGLGILQLVPGAGNLISSHDYFISVTSIDERVANLMSQLIVGAANKQVTVVDLSLSYAIPKKGEDILNVLIKKYIEGNLSDKNAIADSTGKFIRERLAVISDELGQVEDKATSYKQQNKLTDMSEQGKLLVQNTGEFSMELAKVETQVSILTDLENYLKDESKNKRVFPSSLLPQDMVFSGLMTQYNALLIERDQQLLSLTEESPFVKNIDEQIAGLRRGILSSIQNSKNSYVITRNKLRSQLGQAEGQIKDVPEIEKNYLKLARNKDIKQELYIFLMQKAEETAISKTSNISVAKVIDPPKSQVAPISPKRNVIYIIGLLIGLLLPLVYILASNFFNTTILTKEDITTNTVVPVIGEISHNLTVDNLIVANQGRSAISEQFRALRTNLSFYLKTEKDKIILLTSSMSGEGKSFTAINLANILALSGKKVLLMELDLRKPGLSLKLGIDNKIGFSNYTISPKIKAADIIKELPINKNMFIISSGPLPPNPAETLMSEHMPGLINELRTQFDYIIMDSPPVGIIADAQVLVEYADVTLYLVRQGVTERAQLSIVNDLYRTGKIKNLGIVVNDIVSKHYGYGYGYGNYGEEAPNNLWKRIIKNMRG